MGMVEDELKEAKVAFSPTSNGWVKIVCPFHKDTTPSCNVHPTDGGFTCKACQAHGSFADLLSKLKDLPVGVVRLDLDQKYGGTRKPIKAETIARWLGQIWTQDAMLHELYARGLTSNDIISNSIGYENGRIVIPIRDNFGSFVSAKRYKPGAAERKMIWMKGRARGPFVYPSKSELDLFSTVVLAGGEIKALCGKNHFNKLTIGCVCCVLSETSWDPALTPYFSGKTVYIAYDADSAGRAGARIVAANLIKVAKAVHIVNLEFDTSIKSGGLDDWLVYQKAQGRTTEEIQAKFLSFAKEFDPSHMDEVVESLSVDDEDSDEDPEETTLDGAYAPELVGKKLLFRAAISAAENVPRIVPRTWHVSCSKSEDYCSRCVINLADTRTKTVAGDSAFILDAVSSPARIEAHMLKAHGIPSVCKKATIEVQANWNVSELRVGRPLAVDSTDLGTQFVDDGDSNSRKTAQPLYYVQASPRELDLQLTYQFLGRARPNPATLYANLVCGEATVADDDLTKWAMSDEEAHLVSKFRERGDITTRLADLALATERHITGINNRYAMHLTMLLTYASSLYLPYKGKYYRGWMEALIVGDSANGKSDAARYLRQALGLGEVVPCKTATRAGILGGSIKTDDTGRMMVKWGSLVVNDRRLVILEELKGLAPEAFAALTDARSSGTAHIVMAASRSARCRTRLIAISNPDSTRSLSQYPYGVTALKELVRAPEDLRRFDLSCVVSNASQNVLESDAPTPEMETQKLLRALVLSAWTVHAEDIRFTPQATLLVAKEAASLKEQFSPEVPLIDPGSTGLKLARLAVAAANLAGANPEEPGVSVTDEHVQWSVDFLREMYCSEDVGYGDFSTAARVMSSFDSEAIDLIIETIKIADKARSLATFLFTSTTLDATDVMQFGGCMPVEAEEIISTLRRMHALRRVSAGAKTSYMKEASFNSLLRHWIREDELKGIFEDRTREMPS